MLRSCSFAVAALGCAAVLISVSGCGGRENNPGAAAAQRVFSLSIQRQIPLEKESALPVAYHSGLIQADGSGGVRRLDSKLDNLWAIQLEDSDFACSGAVSDSRLLLSSREGNVFCLDADTGSVIWKKRLAAAFSHQPLCGTIDGEPVIWLLSQSDGVLYSLKVADGSLRWTGGETNRSDGNAALWQHKLAYGNCDGAVHLFNAVDGTKFNSIPIGESDQMAGTPLATAEGLLWIGTREGRVALVDLNSEKLIGMLKISEQEAFVAPVAAFNSMVAAGVSEGRVLLCRTEGGQPLIAEEKLLAGGIDSLLYDGSLLYVLAGGTLCALNAELGVESSLNVGDNAGGVVELGNGLLAVTADRSLLLIKGEWK